MIFKFKEKPVIITWYSCGNDLEVEHLYPRFAKDIYPDWFIKLKSAKAAGFFGQDENNLITMKGCPGFVDLFKNAVTVPLWRDIKIVSNRDGLRAINIPGLDKPEDVTQWIDIHHKDQHGDSFNNSFHVKLLNPWLAKCKEPIKWLITDATWHHSNIHEYMVPPGIVDFKYQSSTHVNMFIKKTNVENELYLHAGTPMAYYVPLTDRKIEIKYEQISHQEWAKKFNIPFVFGKGYYWLRNFAEKYNNK